MGSRHDYTISGMIFLLFDSGSGVLDCIWKRNFMEIRDGFCVVTARFCCKAMCIVTSKPNICHILVLKRNIQHVRVSLAHFAVEKK